VSVPPAGLPATAPGPGPDPESVALAALSCPLVAGLHAGAFGEVASYLPGRRIRGVRVTVTEVEVHVVGRYPAPMDEIAAQVRHVLAPLTGSLPVHVVIEDVVLPGEPVTEPAVELDLTSVEAARPATPRTIPRPTGAVLPPAPGHEVKEPLL
jgi:hypothetical protein